MCLSVGLLFLLGASIAFTSNRIVAAVMFFIGLVLLLNAIFDWFGSGWKAWLDAADKEGVIASGRFWTGVNVTLVLICATSGYADRSPVKLGGAVQSSFFCAAALVLIPAIAIGALRFSKRDYFRKPAWNRFPFRSDDPPQTLFLSTWWTFGIFIGELFRLVESGLAYFWTAAMWGSIFVGFLIGQTLAYRLYHKRIAQ